MTCLFLATNIDFMTDMTEWVCEDHPMQEMGHDRCTGAGVLKHTQMFHMMIQRRNALQELKECKALYEDMIQGLYNRVLELEDLLNVS
mgnify:FL=1